MDYVFFTGLIGSIVTVLGAAWPEKLKIKAWQSVKNWLFAVGGLILLLYAVFDYLQGAPVFFVFLEALVIIASILMMIDIDDRIDMAVISVSGLGLIIWSLLLFEGLNTIFFIIGLAGIGLGYAFQMGTLRRTIALLLGSLLIAVFSYLESSWVFFWLNVFFAAFSAYYLYLGILSHRKKSLKEKVMGLLHIKK